MSNLILRGVIPPLVTPMKRDGSLNLEAVPPLIEFMLGKGVHGIFTLGSQGEAFALTPDERIQMLEAVIAAVNGRVPVIAGTGAITTRDAVKHSRRAEQAGADAISVLTPFFITPSQDELYGYYADVAAAVSIPILGYSNPSRTGNVRLAPATVGRLAASIPHFVGIKDSSGSLAETAAMIRACSDDFKVFVGNDSLLYGALCIGAVGGVNLTGNVIPDILVGVYDAFQAGEYEKARALQQRAAILRENVLQIGSYPAQMKAALDMMGLNGGPPRLPTTPLSEEEREKLRALLHEIDVTI